MKPENSNPIVPENTIAKPVDWNKIKKCFYSTPEKMNEAYSLLKDIALNDFDNQDLQRYYFYMGKWQQYNNYDGSASLMYAKSYLYASSQDDCNSTLEAKKAAINLSNILNQRLGFDGTYKFELYNNKRGIMIVENLDIETLLNFASKDRTYPRALYILAQHKFRIYSDIIQYSTKERKNKTLDEIYSLLTEHSMLIKEKTASDLEPVDKIDIKQAHELLQTIESLKDDI